MDLRHVGTALMLMLALWSGAVQADVTRCEANLNGVETVLEFDDRMTEYRSMWEGWSPLAPDCPSLAIIATLKPDVPFADWMGYCVITDDDTGAYLAVVQGKGDRFGRCRTEGTVCRAVNSAKDYGLATVGGIGNVLLGSNAALQAAGVVDAPHNSRGTAGGMILTGVTRVVAGSIGTSGSTVVSTVTAPQVLIGAAAGAVVIGGAILICKE